MNTWAIIEVGGKQYKVTEGDLLDIDRIKADKTTTFDKVLLASGEKGLTIGAPYVEKATVTAAIVGDFRAKKIRVVKFKSKSRYTRTTGHRQDKTKVKIEKVSLK